MTLVIKLSSVDNKTGNKQQMTKLVIMLPSIYGKTGNNAIFSI